MPLPPAKVLKNKQQLENVIQEGVGLLHTQEIPRYTEVARLLTVTHNTRVSSQTLCNRFLGKSKSQQESHLHQQLISTEQEKVLVDWIEYHSTTGHPLSKQTIQKKAKDICGKKPSINWTPLFLSRHPEIKLGKPSGLDPKRAQAFNHTVVINYFKLLKKVIEDNGIPWENIYNMDGKGCQRGGGRKDCTRKFFILRVRRPHYKVWSGNLELVTIIECVSADGVPLAPGFVFQGKNNMCPEWFDGPDEVWYVFLTRQPELSI